MNVQQGHRESSHIKHIIPNKWKMLPHFLDQTLHEKDFNDIVRNFHNESLGKPIFRTDKSRNDVVSTQFLILCAQAILPTSEWGRE